MLRSDNKATQGSPVGERQTDYLGLLSKSDCIVHLCVHTNANQGRAFCPFQHLSS